MEIKYEEVYAGFLTKATDKELENQLKSEDEETKSLGIGKLQTYLEDTFGIPVISNLFVSFSCNDELETINYELKNDSLYDKKFVQNILAQGMVIAWMTSKLDTDLNFIKFFGGKEEKKLMDNYNLNLQRLERLEIKLEKQIRNHGYYNGTYEK